MLFPKVGGIRYSSLVRIRSRAGVLVVGVLSSCRTGWWWTAPHNLIILYYRVGAWIDLILSLLPLRSPSVLNYLYIA